MRISALLLALIFTVACAKKGPVHETRTDQKQNPYYHVVRSNLHALTGKNQEALAEIQKALDYFPDDPFLHYLLAERFVDTFQFEEAEKALEKSLQLNPAFSKPLLLQGALLERREKRVEAEAIYRRLLKKKDASEKTSFLLAENLVKQKKLPEAIQVLQSHIRHNGESVNALYYLATIQKHLKAYFDVAASYLKALQLDGDNQQLRNELAQFYIEMKNPKEALNQYLLLEDRSPFDLGVKLQIASLYEELGKTKKAIEKLKEVTVINPKADRIHYFLGILLEREKQFSDAEKHFSEISNSSELYRDGVFHLVAIYHLQNEFPKAIQILERAIQHQSGIPQFYNYLALALEETGDLKKGIDVLRDGIRHNPNQETLHFELAIFLDKNGEREKSVVEMKRVIEINPDNAEALNYVGYLYAERGEDLDGALKMIEKANQLKPGNGYIIDSLGWIHFKFGNLEKAGFYIRQALKVFPEEPVILEHMGDVVLKQGERGKALQFYRQAVMFGEKKRKPNQEEINRAKAKINTL